MAESLFRRSASNASSSSSHHQHQHQLPNQHETVVHCHQTARSIVFRDHVRRMARLVEETSQEFVKNDDNDDDTASLGSNEADDDDDDGPKDTREEKVQLMLRESLRNSLRLNQTTELDQQLTTMAHEMVPELSGMTFNVSKISERTLKIDDSVSSSPQQQSQGRHVQPLPSLELTASDHFETLLESPQAMERSESWTLAERDVVERLHTQMACVKTIQNQEWTSFLSHFVTPPSHHRGGRRFHDQHQDVASHNDQYPFTSFVTSTSLLPPDGKKMRCYGSTQAYPVGVVFALPTFVSDNDEHAAVQQTQTWAWPAGYAAKTEFNIDGRGQLINGRQEALVSLSTLRQYNDDYLNKQDHMIGGRLIEGGFSVIPYNEVFLRVGGVSIPPNNNHNENEATTSSPPRSLNKGVGLPIALFVRTNTFADLMAMLRVRARMERVLGQTHVQGIPLLYISHEVGVRVLTQSLQYQLLQTLANKVCPFQNPSLDRLTRIHETNPTSLEHKLQELLDLDETTMAMLSWKECAHLAGGIGLTDTSILLLFDKVKETKSTTKKTPSLQDVVLEALGWAIRSDDFYLARQVLLLYCAASTRSSSSASFLHSKNDSNDAAISLATFHDTTILENREAASFVATSVPDELDTDRLRRAVSRNFIVMGFLA